MKARRKPPRGLPPILHVDESPPDPQELRQQISAEVERARREFDTDVTSFERLLQGTDPRLLLAYLSFYRLTTSERRIRAHEPETEFSQHHVELVQAFCLRQPLETFEHAPPDGEALANVSDAVQSLVSASVLRRLPVSAEDGSFAERQLEFVRLHTLGVRNWGQPFQVERLFEGLFAPLEADIRSSLGVSISALTKMAFAALALVEGRISDHLKLFRPVLRAASLEIAAKKLLEAKPMLRPLEARLSSLVCRAGSGDMDDDPMWLLPYTEPYLYDIYSFTLDELVALYPEAVEPSSLKAVLDSWSFQFGDLGDSEPEQIFLANPIWTAPLIRLPDRYLWPIVPLFQSFAFELVEKLLSNDSVLLERYRNRRGRFLELEVEAQLARALPQARLMRRAHWRDSSDCDHENDIVGALGGTLVVAECKSGHVDAAARRGAPSLSEELRKTVVDAARQANALVGELGARQSPLVLHSDSGSFVVDPAATDRFQRMIVTLELLGPWSRISDLQRAGLVPIDLDAPASISLADLQVIVELLEGPSQFLHYLEWRQRWENLHAIYDEHDLLACYQIQRDVVGHLDLQHHQNITHLSARLEPYFVDRWFHRNTEPPRVRLTAWWRTAIAKLEVARPRHWSRLTSALLDFDYADQRSFTRELNQALYRQTQGLTEYAVEAIYAGTATEPRTALVGVAFGREASRAVINETYRQAMAEALEQFDARCVAMFGRAAHGAETEPFVMAGYFQPDVDL
jgi:hypothetical protein